MDFDFYFESTFILAPKSRSYIATLVHLEIWGDLAADRCSLPPGMSEE